MEPVRSQQQRRGAAGLPGLPCGGPGALRTSLRTPRAGAGPGAAAEGLGGGADQDQKERCCWTPDLP